MIITTVVFLIVVFKSTLKMKGSGLSETLVATFRIVYLWQLDAEENARAAYVLE